MQPFFQLIERLNNSQQESIQQELLLHYFSNTPDPERGYTLAILANTLTIPLLSYSQLRKLISDRVDPKLFELSYAYVGDLTETIALIWPNTSCHAYQANEPTKLSAASLANKLAINSVTELLSNLTNQSKAARLIYLQQLLSTAKASERWILLKLLTGKLNRLIAIKSLKQTLARMANVSMHTLEEVWREQTPPYWQLFSWLTGKTIKPKTAELPTYLALMQAKPIQPAELNQLKLNQLQIEWCWNGIRIQLISEGNYRALINTRGDELSEYFPELMSQINFTAILDGVLLSSSGNINHLQQRLKQPNPKPGYINKYPIQLQIFDILSMHKQDLREQKLVVRRAKLEQWYQTYQPQAMYLSVILNITSPEQLQTYRQQKQAHTSGLLFKSLDSIYNPDLKPSSWRQWQQDPYLINAVLLYAQRGQGRFAKYLAEYTVGLWQDQQLLPIAKPYVDLSEPELAQIDQWIKQHTINRFGPVRAVLPQLVFELTFTSVHPSKRHIAGYTLQFPSIKRVRWDKAAHEAGTLNTLQELI